MKIRGSLTQDQKLLITLCKNHLITIYYLKNKISEVFSRIDVSELEELGILLEDVGNLCLNLEQQISLRRLCQHLEGPASPSETASGSPVVN